MRGSRFKEEQAIAILKESDTGTPTRKLRCARGRTIGHTMQPRESWAGASLRAHDSNFMQHRIDHVLQPSLTTKY